MSAQADHDEYEDLHQLVNRLTPTQARHLRLVMRDLVETSGAEPESSSADRTGRSDDDLGFIGVGRSEAGDLAERAKQTVREEIGRPPTDGT